jgi:type II secretory pathway component PulF
MKQEKVHLAGNEKLTLFNNMATMIGAGIPILETVDSLLEDAKGGTQKILKVLREDLVQGKKISDSFARFPNVFDQVTVNLIKVSEEAGSLDTTLQDLTKSIRKDMEFSDKIRSAMIYPAFIIGVFFAIFIMILTFVIPKISSVFSRLNVTLPLPTVAMIALSNLILHNTLLFLGGCFAFILILVIIFKTKKKLVVGLLLNLPVISRLSKDIDLTRFARNFYLLLSSGLPITSALELTEAVVSRREIQSAIKHLTEVVTSGDKLSKGLKDRKDVFPSIMIKIAEAGERTGSLDTSMQNVSEFLDYEVSKSLKNTTALLEPLMLVVVGAMVGGMMLAIIAPIYSMIGQVGAATP